MRYPPPALIPATACWRRAALLTCTLLVTPALAQGGPDAQVRELDAIRVTAPLNQAFEVNVGAFGAKEALEVPLAIQSYDAASIRALSPRTVRDVLAFDPSVLTSNYGGGFDNFRLRGFSMDNFNTIRRDGLALAPHYDMPMELIERVDVLKGPSGFLYGFNSPGGTINYLPKRPTLEPLLDVSVHGSSLQAHYAAVDLSRVLAGGAFGYRVNAGIERIGDFDHLGDLDRRFLGAAADLRFSERALVQLNADWVWKSAMSDPLLRADQSGRADRLDPASFILPPKVNRRHALSPSWYRHETEAYNLEAKFDYRLNDAWTSITQANYSQVERHGGYSDLFDIGPDGEIGYADLFQSRGEIFSTWAVQSYLAGKFTTGRVLHDVFVGASHRQFRDKSPFWDFVESGGGLLPGDISVGNIRNPVQPPRWDFGPEQAIEFQSSIKESSGFASDLMTLNTQFQILLGGRYIRYRARHLSPDAPPQDKNVFVPTGALIYRPVEALMAYISYSRGFEKGDYAPFSANNSNEPTDSIESRQVELGLKADFNRVNLGLALFEIKRDASYLNLNNDFVSSGRFRHRGVEFNTSARIARALTLTGNLAWLGTRLQDVTDPDTLGKRSEGVPRWKGMLGARYLLAGVPGLSLDTALNHVGSRAVDAQNSGWIPGYTLWDAGISYDTMLGNIPTSFRLHGKNLADKYYYPGVFFDGGLEIGRGREVVVSARFRF